MLKLTSSSFKIYNASAGSGKTYTLVKEYLKILFTSHYSDTFKNILAITFTNKAVGEMKGRIIETLKAFSSEAIFCEDNSMFTSLCQELNTKPEQLHTKSKKLLNAIIHNYASFDVSTIDGFVHRVIRTFAHDLKLPLNFEVELDQDTLLTQAVDTLIEKAGTDKKLTKLLVDFAIEKADDDKSWDITYDFNKIAKLLLNENDTPFLESLKHKSLEDFNDLKTNISQQIIEISQQITSLANKTLSLITESGLEYSDFTRSTLPNHFIKASQLNLDGLYKNKIKENLETRNGLHSSKIDNYLIEIIGAILPEIEANYHTQKELVYHLKFLEALYKNLTPLSVLNAINKTLTKLKTENNKLLISEFNTIISTQIKDQPTPFIYERLGEKFRHYFIDEFQDTSEIQWQNLIPLIDNALSSENGTAMLVGDAKQSIYRWRGGKPEQFINIFNKKVKPFQVEQKIQSLDSNFRSSKEIVSFNNEFFKYLSENNFSNATHQDLYLKSNQNIQKEHSGYVNIRLEDIEKGQNKDEVYPEVVMEIINNCLVNGYGLGDICVLVRRKKEGVAIASFLSEKGLKIVSSETLLIAQSTKVIFITNFIKLLTEPNNCELKLAVLNYLATQYNIKDRHYFLKTHVSLNLPKLLNSFEDLEIYIKHDQLLSLSLYELAETIIRVFNLCNDSDAYIQFYLDVVYEFTQKHGSGLNEFLNYFEEKQDSLSIVSPQGQDAVQIMTIHKSKGLEFPVVIFPYADLNIYDTKNMDVWFSLNPEKYNNFSHALINYSQDLESYGEVGSQLYFDYKSQLELDNINLLYVALTRPIEQLYVIAKKDINAKGIVSNNTFSGLLINYLQHINMWNDNQGTYEFGNAKKTSIKKSISTNTVEATSFISTAKEEHGIKIIANAGYLWDTTKKEAIEKGNLVHNMMAKIITKDDISFVIEEFLSSAKITNEQAIELEKVITVIVRHPKLKDYFGVNYTVINERDIISSSGEIIRPDRIVINTKNEAVLIDYKTGKFNSKHPEQLFKYQDTLKQMGYLVLKKILVYINNEVTVKEV